jgi:hypothetical protein
MIGTTVHVVGLREVQRAFREVDKSLALQLGNDLKKAAEPVAVSAKQKVSRYRGASINTIRTRRAGPTIYVEQSAKKVTGKRGDFGALQMRRALEPALDEKSAQVFREVEQVLDHYASKAGF